MESGPDGIYRLLSTQAGVRKYVKKLSCDVKTGWINSRTTTQTTLGVLSLVGRTIKKLSVNIDNPKVSAGFGGKSQMPLTKPTFDNLQHLYIEADDGVLLKFLLSGGQLYSYRFLQRKIIIKS